MLCLYVYEEKIRVLILVVSMHWGGFLFFFNLHISSFHYVLYPRREVQTISTLTVLIVISILIIVHNVFVPAGRL